MQLSRSVIDVIYNTFELFMEYCAYTNQRNRHVTVHLIVVNPKISQVVKAFEIPKKHNTFATKIHFGAHAHIFCVIDR